MIKTFKLIWKDPVWSKLISVGLLAIIALVYNFIKSWIEHTSLKHELLAFWTTKVDLWIVVIVVFAVVIFAYYPYSRFKYNQETLNVDRELFNRIRNEHAMPNLIIEIKTHGFSSRPVKMERIETLIDFLEDSRHPDYQFISPMLEKKKLKLIESFIELDSLLGNSLFGTGSGNWLTIPGEWEYEQPERMTKAIKKIHNAENEVTKLYQEFITFGRRELKV